MKSASRIKVGGRRGNPAYRTPSSFRNRKIFKIKKSSLYSIKNSS